jgi:hypothetical protein
MSRSYLRNIHRRQAGSNTDGKPADQSENIEKSKGIGGSRTDSGTNKESCRQCKNRLPTEAVTHFSGT